MKQLLIVTVLTLALGGCTGYVNKPQEIEDLCGRDDALLRTPQCAEHRNEHKPHDGEPMKTSQDRFIFLSYSTQNLNEKINLSPFYVA